MLIALSTLVASQTKGTKATAKATNKFLNYAASHPDAAMLCKASNMLLKIHSNSSYLMEPKA